MKRGRTALGLALVLCAGAIVLLARQCSRPPVNLKPSSALGRVLAGEVAKLGGETARVVVIGRAAAKSGPDARSEQMSSFLEATKEVKGVTVLATDLAPRARPGMMDMGAASAEQLLGVLEKHREARVAVVFAGLPPYSPQLGEELARRSVRVVAVCGYGGNIRQWLESKALSLAVVPRLTDPPAGGGAPKTDREWFEREFQVVTPEAVPSLPY